MLQRVESEAKISLFTVVDLEGRVPFGRMTLTLTATRHSCATTTTRPSRRRPLRRLLLNALTGKTIQSFETFAPEILAREHLAEAG